MTRRKNSGLRVLEAKFANAPSLRTRTNSTKLRGLTRFADPSAPLACLRGIHWLCQCDASGVMNPSEILPANPVGAGDFIGAQRRR